MSKIVESFRADLSTRTFRVTNSFNEVICLAANEPSLGLYRLQEHIQTNVPKVVTQKQTLQGVFQKVEGACYDLDYARETVASVTSVSQFVKVSELLASAIHLKKQLEERQAQNAHFMETGNSSTSPLSSKTVSHEGAIGESLIITPKSFD